MVTPDLIIFDCDGVLIDSEVLSCRCLSEVLRRYGVDLGVDQAQDLFLGRSVTAVREHYTKTSIAVPRRLTSKGFLFATWSHFPRRVRKKAPHFAGPFFSSFTSGARSPDPSELLLIRLANPWEQECSRKRSQPWAQGLRDLGC